MINATQNTANIKHPNEGQCPAWCASHSRVDVGHRDEAVSHNSATVTATGLGHTLRVNRWEPIDGSPTEDTLWLDGEMISPSEARTFAGLLLTHADQLDGDR